MVVAGSSGCAGRCREVRKIGDDEGRKELDGRSSEDDLY